MRLAACACACACAIAAIASAGTARADGGTLRGVVEVKRPGGVEATPILVYVVGFTEAAPAENVVVEQRDKRFVPDLVALTAGQTVAFPNGDPLLHDVFSPTAERTFDLGSFRHGDTRTRGFPTPGVIEIFCNIHPEMSGTIVVLPNRKFAMTGPRGDFEIRDVPAGTWSVFAYSRRAIHPTNAKVTVVAGDTVTTTLHLDEDNRDFAHLNKYGEAYRPDTTIYNPDE